MSQAPELEPAVRPEVARLDALAKRLRLTKTQRAFAEALVADPKRNQTRAAIAAGATAQPAIQGSRWARLSKVLAYIRALDTAAGQPTAIERTGQAVASLTEVLQHLTRQMYTSDSPAWAGLLLKYHMERAGGDDGGGVRERFRKAFGGDLASIPPEVLRHLDNARTAMAQVVDGKRS